MGMKLAVSPSCDDKSASKIREQTNPRRLSSPLEEIIARSSDNGESERSSKKSCPSPNDEEESKICSHGEQIAQHGSELQENGRAAHEGGEYS